METYQNAIGIYIIIKKIKTCFNYYDIKKNKLVKKLPAKFNSSVFIYLFIYPSVHSRTTLKGKAAGLNITKVLVAIFIPQE